jgi:hypothetical protein
MLTAVIGCYGNKATCAYDSAGRKSTESPTIGGQTYMYNSDNTLAWIPFTGAAIGDLSYGWYEHALVFRLQSATENKKPHLAEAMPGYGFSVGSSGMTMKIV